MMLLKKNRKSESELKTKLRLVENENFALRSQLKNMMSEFVSNSTTPKSGLCFLCKHAVCIDLPKEFAVEYQAERWFVGCAKDSKCSNFESMRSKD